MNNKDAYKEILDVLDRHKELLRDDYSIDIYSRIEARIKLEEISQDFSIELKRDGNPNWCELSEYETIGIYGEEHNRLISWSDDGSQPENERLYQISFPTGAYIFGGAYPQNTFQAFFEELKSHKPKYIDSANHSLYFTSGNAMRVHGKFKEIFEKYRLDVAQEVKDQKVKALEHELASLKDT
jgi:hypothetical protein